MLFSNTLDNNWNQVDISLDYFLQEKFEDTKGVIGGSIWWTYNVQYNGQNKKDKQYLQTIT